MKHSSYNLKQPRGISIDCPQVAQAVGNRSFNICPPSKVVFDIIVPAPNDASVHFHLTDSTSNTESLLSARNRIA
jgi:hypothetical protein